MTDFIDTLVANMEAGLRRKSWRWADLSRASGVSEQFLSSIRKGASKGRIGFHVIYNIASALNLTMEELTGVKALYPNQLKRIQEDLRAGDPDVIAAHLRDMNLDPTSIKIVQALRDKPTLEEWQIKAIVQILNNSTP